MLARIRSKVCEKRVTCVIEKTDESHAKKLAANRNRRRISIMTHGNQLAANEMTISLPNPGFKKYKRPDTRS